MYTFDPTGSLEENVVKERFNISSQVSEFHIWVPHAAPFFKKDLVIRNILTGETLTYGTDYILSDDLSASNRVVESNIYNTVLFIGNSKYGMYEGIYRTVGGGLVYSTRDYFYKLARTLLDPLRLLYSHVTNLPESFPPDHHLHDWSDYRNKQYIGDSIVAITKAIKSKEVSATNMLAPLSQELTDISKYLDVIDLPSHTSALDPHQTTAEDIGALPYGATADQALKVFGQTLTDLAMYVKQKQAEGVDLGSYLDASMGGYLEKIVLAGEAAISSPGNESTFRVVGDNVFYESLGSIDFTSNVDNLNLLSMRAGVNELTIESSPFGPNTDAMKFNGHTVMTGFNIRYHLSQLKFDEQTIVTKNNDVAIISGDGSAQNPLRVDVVLQDANDVQAGVAKFTRDWGDSKSLVIEADLIKGLMSNLTGFVPRERKINGYSMTDNIVIPASDPNIGLGMVDNTSDAEKPVSTAQQALLDQYSPAKHQHPEFIPPTASATRAGIALLHAEWTGNETGWVAPKALSFLDDALELSKGKVATYAGEAIDPNAIYAVIRNVPTVKRGSKIALVAGEQYMMIK